jgi:hypothetical protein
MLTRPPSAPRNPEVVRDLNDRVAAGGPPGGFQPQPLSKIPEPDICQQKYERQEAARLAGVPIGQHGTYAVTRGSR